jgi:hypothetical protein
MRSTKSGITDSTQKAVSGVALWDEHLGTPIESQIQISADSDTCSGKVDLRFSAAGRKSKSHAGRFF